MFDAYKVAVKLTLINDVTKGLSAITGAFASAGKDVDALQSKLGLLRRTALVGEGMTASGLFGLGVISKALKPADDYIHQLNVMNMAGMKQAEIASAIGDAWKLTGQNVTTTATGNLKALLDLRNVTGSLEEARKFLPIMQRMQTILAASKEGSVKGKSDDLSFSAMKALDIRGAVNDPKVLERQADLMTRVIIGTQGRVTPEQFQSVFNYARQAKFALSDDFAYKYLPTLMLENASKHGGGGGSKGVGPALAAMYRFTNQGFVNRKSLPLLQELHLLGAGKILPTSTPGTVVAPLKDASLAASNNFEWTNQIVVPSVLKYLKQHHMEGNDQNVLQVLNMISRGNQLAGSIMGEYYIKRKNFERDRKLIEGTASPEDAYSMAMSKDPDTAHRALSAAWGNFQTSLTMNVAPVLVPALIDVSKGLNTLGDWARRHQTMTKDLVAGFGALSAVMATGGPLITGLAITRIAFAGLENVPPLLTGIASALGWVGKLAGSLGLLTFAARDVYEASTTGSSSSYRAVNGVLGFLTGDDKFSLGSKIYDWTHHQNKPASPYVMPANKSGAVQVHAQINLDGKKVASVVTQHQAAEVSRPYNRAAGFDPSINLAPAGR